MFDKYDRSGDGNLDLMEFIDAMKEMQSQFICGNIQYRIDKCRDRVLRLEDSVKKLLSGVGGKEEAARKAQAIRDEQAAAHDEVNQQKAMSGTEWSKNQQELEAHKQWMSELTQILDEVRGSFRQTREDLRKAFGNKDWDACKMLSDQCEQLKYQMDELDGKHLSKKDEQEKFEKALLETGMSTKQADIELNRLGDMLADADALFGGANAEFSAHKEELAEMQEQYALFQRQLAELEEEGCRVNLAANSEKFDKSLKVQSQYNARIVKECDTFKTHMRFKRFEGCKECVFQLIKMQRIMDEQLREQDKLEEQVRYWRRMLQDKNADAVMAAGGPGMSQKIKGTE